MSETDVVLINKTMCISTGALNARLKVIKVDGQSLHDLGFRPAGMVKAGKYWALADLPKIVNAIQSHLDTVTI